MKVPVKQGEGYTGLCTCPKGTLSGEAPGVFLDTGCKVTSWHVSTAATPAAVPTHGLSPQFA